MTQKISFTVENAEMVSENTNSNFAVLSLDFFASGENLHDMYVSEETLMRTANSIKNCPLVWKYDEKLDDIYTHDKDEVPCGFVPETSEIESRKLPDGRTMLSVVAYVWKRYTGEILNFFKRDGGRKPVSVEMSVYDTQLLPNGLTEILDFKYEGITVLGTFVTPAIPMANATVLSFSKIKDEYEKDYSEFYKNFADIDMTIPQNVKNNAKRGLELRKEYGRGGTSVGMASARYLISHDKISPEKVRHVAKYFPRHKGDNLSETDPPSNGYIAWLLWGGTPAWKWAQSIVDRLDKKEQEMAYARELVTFPYKTIGDANPAIRGIDPPVTVGQANEIARQAESIGSDDKKNGWAIAISSFKKTHVVKDGKWVKKAGSTAQASFTENMSVKNKTPLSMESYSEKMEMTMEKEELKEEMAAPPVEEMAELPTQEEKENPSEEKLSPEEMKKVREEKKFEFPKNFNMEMMEKMFAEEEEEEEEGEEKEVEIKLAKAEMAKGMFADPSVMMSGMFAKMCKMAEKIEKMAADKKVYMEEMAALKQFKADMEMSQKMFEVEKTLKEMAEKVQLPQEAKEEMAAEAEKYSFATLEQWKTYVKAKSFEFAIKETSKSDVVKVGMPFSGTTIKRKDDLWS